MQEKQDMFQIGAITATHGVRGEVKVFPTTDNPNKFKKLKKIVLDTGKETQEMEIASVKFFKNLVILKFKGFDSLNDVEKFKGKTLWITREQSGPLGKDEYYRADLIDLQVVSDTGEALGLISDVLETGANDVYEISMPNGKKVLIPAIKDCIKQVDMDARVMTIHVMDGLFED